MHSGESSFCDSSVDVFKVGVLLLHDECVQLGEWFISGAEKIQSQNNSLHIWSDLGSILNAKTKGLLPFG